MSNVRLVAILALMALPAIANAQTSSIGAVTRKHQRHNPPPKAAREAPQLPRNAVYERHGWVTTKPKPPKIYRPGDLLTIIIRENKRWESEADLSTRKQWNLTSEVAAFLKFSNGGLAPTTFKRGVPDVDYEFQNRLRSDGDSSRQDSLTSRLTAKIIDVKPNGILVIEGTARMIHDDEVSIMTVVGYCRKQDVTADNTVLSTQLAGKEVSIINQGTMRAVSRRGWLGKIVDWFGPI